MVFEYLTLEVCDFVDEVGWVIAQPLISLFSALARPVGTWLAVYYADCG